MDTPSNIARFKRERNILANLDHPNIARLLDGGVTDDGLPYLVMEYVEGVPLPEYCNSKRLRIDERLSLFKDVCKAVRHAHQSAVIHRDLKPSNILVTEDGSVKVLDFGIAKLLEPDDPESALLQTRTGARMLTLGYAAPEQLESKAVTTATDSYTLGILLYELLAGVHPFDMDDKDLTEIEQTIRNEVPERPSGKSQTLTGEEQKKRARIRNTTASALITQLQGDLDAITLKALRKEPNARYNSAEQLLEDLQRREKNLPVIAREDTFRYNSSKYVRRHQTGLLVAAGFLLLIIGFNAFYTWQITEERNRAELEAEKAQAVTAYLTDLFQASNPNYSKGDTITARQLLDTGENKINELNNQPAIKGEMLDVLGNIYNTLTYTKKSDSLLTKALAVKKEIYGINKPELATAYFSLALSKHNLGKYNTAIGLLDTAITYQKKIFGINSTAVGKSIKLRAETLRENGKIDSAYAAIRQSQSIFQILKETKTEDYLSVIMEKGAILIDRGNYSEAEKIWDKSLQLSNELFDSPHPKILNSTNGFADVLRKQDKFAAAESLYQQGMSMTKELYGKRHTNTAVSLNSLANLYFNTEEYQKSDSLYAESYAILTEILGEKHPYVVSTLYNRANLKSDMGNLEEAKTLYLKVLEADKATLGKNHPNVASDYSGLANLYKRQKKYEQAIVYLNKSLEIRQNVYDNPDHPYIAYNERSIADIRKELGQYKKAERRYKSALTSLLASFDRENAQVKTTAAEYAAILSRKGSTVSADSLTNALKPTNEQY